MEQHRAYVTLTEAADLEWVSGAARLENGDVVLRNRSRPFSVHGRELKQHRSVLDDLRSVQEPEHARRFAQRWGLLRHGPDSAELREPISAFIDTANALRTVLDLTYALRASVGGNDNETNRLGELIAELDPTVRESNWLADLDVERTADRLIVAYLNRGLASVSPGVVSAAWIEYPVAGSGSDLVARGEAGHFYHGPRFRDLIGYAFLTLAQHIWTRAELFRCAYCGAVNGRTHGNQRYCPSRCESRAKEARRGHRRRREPREQTLDDVA